MKKKIFLLGIIATLTLACNLPAQVTLNTPEAKSTVSDLVLTVTAQAQLLANTNNQEQEIPNPSTELPINPATATNTPVPLPTVTASPVLSSTPEATATPSQPMASVSVDTNCRTGPGQVYDAVGALLVGESTEVTGKNTSSDYWIIKNPDNPTATCWLWGQYATVSGDQTNLAEISIPPSPTPTKLSPPNAVSNLNGSGSCDNPGGSGYHLHTISGTISWQDNANNEQGFNIYADYLHGDPPKQIGSVDANTTSYHFSVITLDNPFTLLVTSYNAAGSAKRMSVNIPNNCHP